MDTDLLLQPDAAHRIASAQRSVGVHQKLGNEEKRDSLRTLRRAGQTRKHHMDDVLGEIVITPGDVDFLPGNGVAAVCIRRRLGGQRADITAGLRLGQVHRPGPVTGDEFRQVGLLLAVRSMGEQGFDGAVAQHWAKAERHVGRVKHFHHAEGERARQALPAPLFRRGKAHPATCAKGVVGGLEPVRCDHAFIAQPCALRITLRVQRRQHFAGEFGGLLQDRTDNIVVVGTETGKTSQFAEPGYLLEGKLNFIDRGVIGHRNSVSWIGVMRAG